MGDLRKRVTSTEVAKASGVSRATVSYVLNDTPGQAIPPSTRQRVLDAAASLQYRPDRIARALRNGHSDVVVFVLPDFPLGHVMSNLLDALSSALFPYGRRLVMARRVAGVPIDDIVAAVSPFAVISLGPLPANEIARLGPQHVRIEVIDTGDRADERDALARPQRLLGSQQAEYLIGKGHRSFGYAMPDDVRLKALSGPRLAGVVETVARAGLPTPSIRTIGENVADLAAQVGLWHADGITGICAYNDDTAIAVIAGARECRLRVPEDIAVIGIDDIPMASLVVPPLTTMRIRLDGLATSIAEDLMDIPEDARTRIDSTPELIIRASA